MLDSDVFRADRESSRDNYQAYVCRYSTMILFSDKTRTPLAALSLVPGKTAKGLLTRRPDGNFQGMLDKDGAEFQWCFSNLLPNGHLSFQIFEGKDEVRPINQVNAVKAQQSYLIPCDQRTKKAMKIQVKKKKEEDGGGHISINEAESKDGVGSLKFNCIVNPESGNKLFDEGTVWQCVPGFVLKEERPVMKSRGYGGVPLALAAARPMAASGYAIEEGGFSFGGSDSGIREGFMPPPIERLDESNTRLESSAKKFKKGGPRSKWRNWFGGSRGAEAVPAALVVRQNSRGGNNVDDALVALSRQSDAVVEKSMVPEEEESADGALFAEEPMPQYRSLSLGGPAAAPEPSPLPPLDIGKTAAVDLAYGDKEIEVKSTTVELNINYEVSAAPCKITMSLWEDMWLREPNFKELFAAEIDDLVKNQGQNLLKALKQIFKSSECVIDLESPADTVLLQCGHQCINHANAKGLDKCPLCRSHITAMVKAEAML